MEDSGSGNRGFQVGSEVYSMADVNGALVVGGTFYKTQFQTLYFILGQ